MKVSQHGDINLYRRIAVLDFKPTPTQLEEIPTGNLTEEIAYPGEIIEPGMYFHFHSEDGSTMRDTEPTPTKTPYGWNSV